MRKPIFVAATRQHVGKTTVSLALMSGLQKRFEKVGFIKPVGQQHIPITENGQTMRVDKVTTEIMDKFRGEICVRGTLSHSPQSTRYACT